MEVIEEWEANMNQDISKSITYMLKEDILYMDSEIDTEMDITEILYRKKREPIRVNKSLTICPTCRKQLKDGHSYCKRCGQAILRNQKKKETITDKIN